MGHTKRPGINGRALALVGILVSAAGCSAVPDQFNGEGKPFLDSISASPTFVAKGHTYSVDADASFHDVAGMAVTHLRERISAFGLDVMTPTGCEGSGADEQHKTIPLRFDAPSALAHGTSVEIDVSVVDGTGAESNVEVLHIVVP